jgi:DNA (cytosine-5)-methyltransferase 1
MPTFGSLFAGIGGIDLGLERAGWECRWQVEWEPFCQHVLGHHWPSVRRYGDVTRVDWDAVERVDLVAGGFPCQPVSNAGRKLAQGDERWLWPEFYRAIRALRPSLVLVENVPGLLDRGMGDVIGGLASLGYDSEWDCVPAAAVGAPHIRDRLWVVAYPAGSGYEGQRWDERGLQEGSLEEGSPRGGAALLADATGERQPGPRQPFDAFDPTSSRYREAATPVDGGRPSQWESEPDVGRVAHGIPARVDRLRALGNAVVPQVVEVIGRRMIEML